MSTDDLPKPTERLVVDDALDPVILIRKKKGRFECLCGRTYSREIVVVACEARGHQPNPMLQESSNG
jgi:hypothetical protein